MSTNGNLYMLAANGGGNAEAWMWSNSTWTPLTPSSWKVSNMWIAGGVLYIEANSGNGSNLVWQYVPPGGAPTAGDVSHWTALTGANTVLSASAAPLLVQDGIELFMLANNGAGNRVWEFQSALAGWLPLTSTATYAVNTIDVSNSDVLQMYASQNGGPWRFFNYGGSANTWSPQ
jgi:hypothetical protein